MGLDIWFREDIRNALLAADEVSWSILDAIPEGVPVPEILKAWLKGYRKALVTVALSFGLQRDFSRKEEQGANHQASPGLEVAQLPNNRL